MVGEFVDCMCEIGKILQDGQRTCILIYIKRKGMREHKNYKGINLVKLLQ